MEKLEHYFGKNLNQVYSIFESEYYSDDLLVHHRTHIEANRLGYGEKAFHTLWRELVKLQKPKFKFLEIGVYKGQVLSLVKLLANAYNKNVSILGVTPLSPAGDKYSKYDDADYGRIIEDLFLTFNLDFDPASDLLIGSSIDESIKERLREIGPFDLVYIDGCHDYEYVVSDIKIMKHITAKDSIVVFDDSACFTELSNDRFKGHLDVCRAVKEMIESDPNFQEIICVGHNRAFRRIE